MGEIDAGNHLMKEIFNCHTMEESMSSFQASSSDSSLQAEEGDVLEGAAASGIQSKVPASFGESVITNVMEDLKDTFQGEGVSVEVLELLQKLWITKLQKAAQEDPQVLEPPPEPVNLGARPKKKTILQVDGPNDSSDSDDEVNDDDIDDDDDDDDDENEDEDGEDEGPEDEPLGSGDDISEGDPSDLFNTENVVVCQYDKIQRTRNKWKFHLKDGIMNLNGKDYVFQKATGEAEW